jgi:hypothetical protein
LGPEVKATALLLLLLSSAATQALPPEAEAVQKYILEKDYPERFKDTSYRTRIEDLLIVDVNGDGENDVVVHFYPHYRQSPTVVIYRLSNGDKVTRVLEGLAPGALQPISGDYLDSHALGEAADIELSGDQDKPAARDRFLKAAMTNFGGVVSYPAFWHVDSRSGGGSYVDMTSVPNPPEVNKCEAFEFSKVRQIAFGSLKGETKKYLAAWVNSEIYLYSLQFRADGLLDKTVEVWPAPEAFNGFLPGEGLLFANDKGGTDTLARQGTSK